eukprot:4842438-Prymnesium_polylepis.1
MHANNVATCGTTIESNHENVHEQEQHLSTCQTSFAVAYSAVASSEMTPAAGECRTDATNVYTPGGTTYENDGEKERQQQQQQPSFSCASSPVASSPVASSPMAPSDDGASYAMAATENATGVTASANNLVPNEKAGDSHEDGREQELFRLPCSSSSAVAASTVAYSSESNPLAQRGARNGWAVRQAHPTGARPGHRSTSCCTPPAPMCGAHQRVLVRRCVTS